MVELVQLIEFVSKSRGGLVLLQEFNTNSTNSNTVGTSSTLLQEFNTNSTNSNTGTSSTTGL